MYIKKPTHRVPVTWQHHIKQKTWNSSSYQRCRELWHILYEQTSNFGKFKWFEKLVLNWSPFVRKGQVKLAGFASNYIQFLASVSLIIDFCKMQLTSGFQTSFFFNNYQLVSILPMSLSMFIVPWRTFLCWWSQRRSILWLRVCWFVFFVFSIQVWKWCAALQGAQRWGWQVFPLGGEVQFFERAGRLSQIHICLQEPANISPGYWTGATGKRNVLVEFAVQTYSHGLNWDCILKYTNKDQNASLDPAPRISAWCGLEVTSGDHPVQTPC